MMFTATVAAGEQFCPSLCCSIPVQQMVCTTNVSGDKLLMRPYLMHTCIGQKGTYLLVYVTLDYTLISARTSKPISRRIWLKVLSHNQYQYCTTCTTGLYFRWLFNHHHFLVTQACPLHRGRTFRDFCLFCHPSGSVYSAEGNSKTSNCCW